MAKSNVIYNLGDRPRSKSDITKEYIQDFYALNVAASKIDEQALDKWINIVREIEKDTEKSAMKKFAEIRTKFIELNFPEMNDKNSYSNCFETLKTQFKKS